VLGWEIHPVQFHAEHGEFLLVAALLQPMIAGSVPTTKSKHQTQPSQKNLNYTTLQQIKERTKDDSKQTINGKNNETKYKRSQPPASQKRNTAIQAPMRQERKVDGRRRTETQKHAKPTQRQHPQQSRTTNSDPQVCIALQPQTHGVLDTVRLGASDPCVSTYQAQSKNSQTTLHGAQTEDIQIITSSNSR